MPQDRDRLVLAAFLANATFAGGNAVAIRFSNRELAPLWGAGVRFALAAVLFAALMAALRLSLPRGRALAGAAVWGLLQFTGAFGLFFFALVRIHAGFGQILLALVPLATLLLAVAERQERMRAVALLGALLGLGGVMLIAQDPLRDPVPLTSLLAVFGSVLCFAQAAVVVRRFPPVHALTLNAVGTTCGAAALVVLSAAMREPMVLPERRATWVALAYVVVLGTIVVFALYVFVIQQWGASRAAYGFVIIPFVTVVLSAWLDDEPVGPGLLAGGLLVVTGVYIGALRPSVEPSQRDDGQPEVNPGPRRAR